MSVARQFTRHNATANYSIWTDFTVSAGRKLISRISMAAIICKYTLKSSKSYVLCRRESLREVCAGQSLALIRKLKEPHH